MSDDDAADKAFAALKEIFSQPFPMKSYRTYDLKFVDGEPVFIRQDIRRDFGHAVAKVTAEVTAKASPTVTSNVTFKIASKVAFKPPR